MSKFMTSAELLAKLPKPGPKRVRRPWTAEDDADLERRLRKGHGLSDIARTMGRSAQLIQNKRRELIAKDPSLAKCAQIRSSCWTGVEDVTLREMWGTGASYEDIAVALGRSIQSVKARRRLIKLPVRLDTVAGLRTENARLREARLLDMRKAYEAGYSTCKIGAGLKEGWETFAPTALS